MKNISEILKKTRIQSGLTLDEIESNTKIKKSYLEFIENGEFNKLPSISAAKGFIKIYSKYLGLNYEEALVIFRRENKNEENHMLTKKKRRIKVNSIKNKYISLYIFLISLILILALIYGIHEYIIFKMPPKIEMYTPSSQNFTTHNSSVLFSGKITLGDYIYIDGDKINNINLNGTFSQKVGLQEGLNNINIKIKNPLGGQNIKYYEIDYVNNFNNKINAKNAFYINIKDISKPIFLNATTQNKTIYNKILKGDIKIKGIASIVLSIGQIQNVKIFYKGKNIAPSGIGFSIIIIKYNNGKISVTKN
jgi:transcriptional regulator with XRE-family HTH domain